MHSGIERYSVVIMEGLTTHDITPAFGTVRTLAGGQGSLLIPGDYPLIARCIECHRRVRIDRYMFGQWYHVYEGETTA